LSETDAGPARPDATRRRDRRLELIYRAGLLLKSIDGAFELLAGLALWLVPGGLHDIIEPFARPLEGPHPYRNFLAYWFGRMDHSLVAGHHTFLIVFLIAHGVLKLVLVYCLLRRYRWAYPGAIGLLSAFAVYQIYVLIRTPTFGMAFLTALDLLIIWLVWREWRRVRPARST
jgi:uncharacterized membrane protein